MREKSLIIVVGPSGAGKSSFVDKAIEEMDFLEDTKTFTTRNMRSGEKEGDPYHYVSREKFESLIKDGFFVEWANVHDNLYGTPHYQITEAWEKGKVIIMDVDIQGAETFKKKFQQAFTVFILPPSMQELRERVARRDGAESKDLDLRMENAKKELALASTFDAQLTNDEFSRSYAEFKKLIEEFLKGQ